MELEGAHSNKPQGSNQKRGYSKHLCLAKTPGSTEINVIVIYTKIIFLLCNTRTKALLPLKRKGTTSRETVTHQINPSQRVYLRKKNPSTTKITIYPLSQMAFNFRLPLWTTRYWVSGLTRLQSAEHCMTSWIELISVCNSNRSFFSSKTTITAEGICRLKLRWNKREITHLFFIIPGLLHSAYIGSDILVLL